ncbi:MAG: tRNA (adenosine(37)-N6)-threonylcarbamoyltransferase complex ATPase subunit type 1 TsaE [Alphaproteobacteria bacterium]
MISSNPLVMADLPRRQLESFAARLAGQVRQRDVITLSGDLGAGKTVFARAFIRALTNEDEDVPSPTFTLVQLYDAAAGKTGGVPLTIWHFDLYRLKTAQEIYEIGFEEALSDGVSLIEWPQRAERLLPRERLEIQIQIPAGKADKRTLTLTARGADWQDRMEKTDLCRNALNT